MNGDTNQRNNGHGGGPATGLIGVWESAEGELGEKSVGKIPLRRNRSRPERWAAFERAAKW